MELSIIILTYNSSKYIGVLLESIWSAYKTKINNQKIEVIIADNKSQDGTKTIVAEHKFAKFLENDENAGFAKGINIAEKHAKGEILIFINPDSKMTGGNLENLINEFSDDSVGIVGGEITNSKGGRELSCGKTYTLLNTVFLALGLEEVTGVRFAPDIRQEVDHVSGAFLAIRKSLFEKLNGFDEHYFMYVEDADLCFRAKKLGFKVIYSPKASMEHVGQGSSNRAFAVANIYKGLLYFHKKNMGFFSYFFTKLVLKMKANILVIIGNISNNQYLVETYGKALKVF